MTAALSPPDAGARAAARHRLDALAKPLGALGRLEDLAVWLAGVQGTGHPVPPASVAVVIFAGDHGITCGPTPVSAYPRDVTPAMVREFHRGGAAVNVLARAHDARVSVLDLGVDDDLADLPARVRKFKVRRGSGAIDRDDALTAVEVEAALTAGAAIADEEIDAGADLLLPGDMGIGNTTVAATLVGGVLGRGPGEVTGTGTGIGSAALAQKRAVVEAALRRARPHRDDPVGLLRTVGGADVAAMTGFLRRCSERGAPVLLDGVVSGACGLVAEMLAPGAAAWWCAGHRSTEPSHRMALEALGLEPVVDLGMRLGEASGALVALPVLRAAALLLGGMSTLDEIIASQTDPSS